MIHMADDNINDSAGGARAPGPSVADTLASDRISAEPWLLTSTYEFLGDEDIDSARYTSTDFFADEMHKMWSRTWQWACREEHIPNAGDYYVYDIGDLSIIVTRTEQSGIKAYLNSCTHRGTRLIADEGKGHRPHFTCPFHGWSWELEGTLRPLPGGWDFPHVDSESHALQPVSCETWGGFVFVNPDPGAKPLAQHLGILSEHFQGTPLDRRKVALHVQKILPANWKASQEAFMEAYHNFHTHHSPNGANAQYDIFGENLSRFIHNIGSYSPESLADYPGKKWRDPVLTEEEMLAGLAVNPAPLQEGETARSVAAQQMREDYLARLGVDLSTYSDSLMLDSIEYHLFPNMFMFPGVMVPMVYRFRPLGMDVDQCVFDLLIMEPLPDGAEVPLPPEPIRLEVEQSYTEVEALSWLGPVYDEDTGNLALQQQGLKTSRKGITLGNYQEARIRNLHKTLDKYLNS
jgi:nitrite reductase/ring-hydroxylating ferredoxin subunit